MSYVEQYRQAFEALGYSLSETDGVSPESIAEAEQNLGVRLPAALRDYYIAAGRCNQFNRAHNRLYSPDKLFVDLGKLVFIEENQRVNFWAVEINEMTNDDAAVFNGTNNGSEPIEWYPEHAGCSEFLKVMLYWQAVNGGLEYAGMTDVTQETLDELTADWQFIGKSQDLQAYAKPGRALCIIGDADNLELFVASDTEEDFELLDEELSQMGVEIDHL